MVNLQKAYLATIQRFRDYYEDSDTQKLALRPITSNDGPLIDELTVEDWNGDANAAYENEYYVAAMANEVVTEPHKYTQVQNMCWDVYKAMLDYMETTTLIHEQWQDAKNNFSINRKTAGASQMRFYNTLVDDLQWEEEILEEAEFDTLIAKAEKDEVFLRAFRETYGDYSEASDEKVTQVKFMKAEVKIIRPWLDKMLLTSRDWRLKEGRTINAKDYLSDDATERAYTGALPGLPIKFILVKEVSVSFELQGEKEDNEGQKGPLLHFGPLLLNGSLRWLRNSSYTMQGLTAYKSTNHLIRQNLVYNLKDAVIQQENNEVKYSLKDKPGNAPLPYAEQVRLQDTKFTHLSTRSVTSNTSSRGLSSSNNKFTTSSPLMASQIGAFNRTASVWKKNASTPTHCQLKGRIIDKESNGLTGVDVLIQHTKMEGTAGLTKLSTDEQGNFEVKLQQKQSYQIVLIKNGFEKIVDNLNIENDSEITYVKRLNKITVKDRVEVESDIQLLAIIYDKLGKVPNPIPGFIPIGDSLDDLVDEI